MILASPSRCRFALFMQSTKVILQRFKNKQSMNPSPKRGRRWAVVKALVKYDNLRNIHSSSESNSGDDDDDDEGFGVEHSADLFMVASSLARSASERDMLFIAAPSGVGNSNSNSNKDKPGVVSPERVQQEHTPKARGVHGIVLTPSDANSSLASESPPSPSSSTKRRPGRRPEDAPEMLPGKISFPPISLSDFPSAPNSPEDKQEIVDRAPLDGSQIHCSPSLTVDDVDEDKQPSPTIDSSTSFATSSSPTKSGQSAFDGVDGAALEPEMPQAIRGNPRSEKERSSQEERNFKSLIAVLSLMVGLTVPARFSLLVLLACYSAAVAIITRLAPALRSAAKEGRLMSFVALALAVIEERQELSACSNESTTPSEASKVPLLHGSAGSNGLIAGLSRVSKVPLLHRSAVEVDSNKATPMRSVVLSLREESSFFFSVSGSCNRFLALAGVGKTQSESPKLMTEGRFSDGLMDVQHTAGVSGGEEVAEDQAPIDGHGDRKGDQGSEFNENDSHHHILTSLSEDHRAFTASAGEKEQHRLVQQCLAYANGDIQQAQKVCGKFCKFRVENGWSMLLSPAELEVPLRSRTHTLAQSRDKIGRAILTFSPGKMDMTKCPAASYQKMLCYVLQEVVKDEELQTEGIVLLVDARNVGFNTLKHFKMTDYRRGLGMLSGAFPAKLKAIRILHPTRALRVALAIGMPLMSSKMQARLQVVSDEGALEGSFTKDLADPAVVPMELGIGGTWEDSKAFWDSWVDGRVRAVT